MSSDFTKIFTENIDCISSEEILEISRIINKEIPKRTTTALDRWNYEKWGRNYSFTASYRPYKGWEGDMYVHDKELDFAVYISHKYYQSSKKELEIKLALAAINFINKSEKAKDIIITDTKKPW